MQTTTTTTNNNGGLSWVVSSVYKDKPVQGQPPDPAPPGMSWHWTAYKDHQRITGWAATNNDAINQATAAAT